MNLEPFASIAVLCTDDRQRAAADALCRRGYVVERLIPGESDPLLLAQTDFLLLPVLVEPGSAALACAMPPRYGPALRQGDRRAASACQTPLPFAAQLSATGGDALLNAVPTAEAAIELALSQLPITLWESRCLLTGFGRCAKPLARLLTAFGAQLTVCARSPKDLALARSFGLTALPLAQMEHPVACSSSSSSTPSLRPSWERNSSGCFPMTAC